jgi:hypothetical protein
MTRGRVGWPTALVLLVAALAAGVARAHSRSSSSSSWEIRRGSSPVARILVRVTWNDLEAAIPALARVSGAGSLEALALADAYLRRQVRLEAAGTPCAPVGESQGLPAADPSHLVRAWRVVCSAPGPLVAVDDAFFDASPAHFHLASFRLDQNEPVERVLVAGERRFALPAAGGAAAPALRGAGLREYVVLGVKHIASGADHLAFLIGLLLLGSRLGEVVTLVTGFTAAHSVTLALGVLGVVRPAPATVEALIGLSIAIVALENFAETVGARTRRGLEAALVVTLGGAAVASAAGRGAVSPLALCGVGLFAVCYFALVTRATRPGSWRWFVAFVFGLVHGFGFAGVLIESALPAERVLHALFGFNAGVEIGQLAVVALAWPLLHRLTHPSRLSRGLWIQLGSTPILAAGVYWFVSRGFG